MANTTNETDEPQGTHFWFMTMQTPNAAGYFMNSYQGTWTPGPEETRLDMFNSLRSLVEETDPRSRGGTVIAFDIQPNQITRTR